jgi:hypothetical protein
MTNYFIAEENDMEEFFFIGYVHKGIREDKDFCLIFHLCECYNIQHQRFLEATTKCENLKIY